MKKLIMVDGNNLLFRSYYATAYNGNFMKNSKDFPTNALYGFVNMMNKIIAEEKPQYIIVAFDKGKTFRHDKYKQYKLGRIETPKELKEQFPVAKELLTAMGIKYYEIDNYEADDIIGTFSKFCDIDTDYIGTIISSDKDLLQLLSSDVDIKLLKQKDYIRYDVDGFKKEYGINPINIIDLKALMGDPSDNIPGVKGIGEKTALKLLQEYETLDNIYANLDKISGKLKEKLIEFKEDAYNSYDIATIYTKVPMEIDINDALYKEKDTNKLNLLYEELEFYSLLKKEKVVKTKDIKVTIVNDVNNLKILKDSAIYLEISGSNYHNAKVLGIAIYNEDNSYYIPIEKITNLNFIKGINLYTYDYKKLYVALKYLNLDIDNVVFDAMITGYLLDYNIKDDIAYLANEMGYDIPFYDAKLIMEQNEEELANSISLKAKFIYETYDELVNKIKKEGLSKLLNEIEFPLITVLGDMEYEGVFVDKRELIDMGEEINIKLDIISKQIYNQAGTEFNISSPMQLSEILFEKLNLPHGKKGKTGYSTASEVLTKLKDTHAIIDNILEYRMLMKLYSTYIEGLLNNVSIDSKIHTIYTQVVTRTGRLSSIEPNLQNIPIRTDYGRLIRKAFVPSKDSVIISADYSQIELRVLAHMSKVKALLDSFKEGIDIHTKTASDILKKDISLVTKNDRRLAKAVNFGIIYGISSYGLSENAHISVKEAGEFIEKYFETYPGVKKYMDKVIKEAYDKGYVTTLFDRKRYITELSNPNYIIQKQGERMALNTPIQGTSADIIKKAMIAVAKEFKKHNLKSKMILQVHDELIFDVLKEEREIVKPIIKEVMENICALDIPLEVDIEEGKNWYQAK